LREQSTSRFSETRLIILQYYTSTQAAGFVTLSYGNNNEFGINIVFGDEHVPGSASQALVTQPHTNDADYFATQILNVLEAPEAGVPWQNASQYLAAYLISALFMDVFDGCGEKPAKGPL
jgi:hypothetical protein